LVSSIFCTVCVDSFDIDYWRYSWFISAKEMFLCELLMAFAERMFSYFHVICVFFIT
jgi:hypothetical protein